jgi:hypothetical protein
MISKTADTPVTQGNRGDHGHDCTTFIVCFD